MKKIAIILYLLFISNDLYSLINSEINQNYFNFNGKIDRVYVLGDSLSDTGVLTGVLTDYLNNNRNLFSLPLVISFEQPQSYMGRSFTNGEVAVEVLAKKMGKTLTPGWNVSPLFLNSDLGVFSENIQLNGSIKIGTNYAVSTAKAADGNTVIDKIFFNKFSLDKQVIALLEGKGNHNLKNDLFVIMIGGNDVFSALKIKDKYIIDNAVNGIENAMLKLYYNEAKNFIVTNVPNVGRTPIVSGENEKIIANQLSIAFNMELNKKISNFKKNKPEVKLIFIDMYNLFDKFLDESKKKSIDILKPCLTNIPSAQNIFDSFSNLLTFTGFGIVPFYYEPYCSFSTIDNFFFFDHIHPTKLIHNELGTIMYKKLVLSYTSQDNNIPNCAHLIPGNLQGKASCRYERDVHAEHNNENNERSDISFVDIEGNTQAEKFKTYYGYYASKSDNYSYAD